MEGNGTLIVEIAVRWVVYTQRVGTRVFVVAQSTIRNELAETC